MLREGALELATHLLRSGTLILCNIATAAADILSGIFHHDASLDGLSDDDRPRTRARVWKAVETFQVLHSIGNPSLRVLFCVPLDVFLVFDRVA